MKIVQIKRKQPAPSKKPANLPKPLAKNDLSKNQGKQYEREDINTIPNIPAENLGTKMKA